MGRNCERRNTVLMQCLPDCSTHGEFDVENGKCNCHNHWTGRECNISKLTTSLDRVPKIPLSTLLSLNIHIC